MMNPSRSRQVREADISRFLSSCDQKELTRATEDFVAAERRYAKVRKRLPLLAKGLPEGGVMPLMGLFDWEVEIFQMSYFEGALSQSVGVKSRGLSDFLKLMKEFKLVPIFSFCFGGEFSSSGCTLYALKLPEDVMKQIIEEEGKVAEAPEEVIDMLTKFVGEAAQGLSEVNGKLEDLIKLFGDDSDDDTEQIVNEMRGLFPSFDDTKPAYKLVRVHSLLKENKDNPDCDRAADLIAPTLGIIACGEIAPFDFSIVADLQEGTDYKVPLGAGGHKENGMVLEKSWLRGAVAIVNHAMQIAGVKTRIESPAPRKTTGGEHHLYASK